MPAPPARRSLPLPVRLTTQRMLLRPWSQLDAPRLRAALDRSAEHLRPWIPFMRSEPRTLEATADWLGQRRGWFDSGQHACYAACSLDGSALLGEVLLLQRGAARTLEIGYWIDVDHVGRGYASEGAAALTRAAFELTNADLVEIACAADNAASSAVPRRLGYTLDATLRGRNLGTDNIRRDLELWSLFREEYRSSGYAWGKLEVADRIDPDPATQAKGPAHPS